MILDTILGVWVASRELACLLYIQKHENNIQQENKHKPFRRFRFVHRQGTDKASRSPCDRIEGHASIGYH